MNTQRKSWLLASLALVLLGSLPGCSERPEDSAAQAAPMEIIPNVSVGKIHAGMTTQELVAALGEPQRRIGNALEYGQFGLAVMHGPDGIVQVVMGGDVMGINGPFAKKFTGRTREGIGMNSAREEVIRAYGEPAASSKTLGHIESLQYPQLGINFSLENGRVHHMVIRLTGSLEADRAATPSPAPGGK
jgi:hypothetical protein